MLYWNPLVEVHSYLRSSYFTLCRSLTSCYFHLLDFASLSEMIKNISIPFPPAPFYLLYKLCSLGYRVWWMYCLFFMSRTFLGCLVFLHFVLIFIVETARPILCLPERRCASCCCGPLSLVSSGSGRPVGPSAMLPEMVSCSASS